MPKELRNEIRHVLGHLIDWNRESEPKILPSNDLLRIEALGYLTDVALI